MCGQEPKFVIIFFNFEEIRDLGIFHFRTEVLIWPIQLVLSWHQKGSNAADAQSERSQGPQFFWASVALGEQSLALATKIWVNYNDLTATSLRGIIPIWP